MKRAACKLFLNMQRLYTDCAVNLVQPLNDTLARQRVLSEERKIRSVRREELAKQAAAKLEALQHQSSKPLASQLRSSLQTVKKFPDSKDSRQLSADGQIAKRVLRKSAAGRKKFQHAPPAHEKVTSYWLEFTRSKGLQSKRLTAHERYEA
eukprot:1156753-Pelagomonas_calceolata.AAC.9